MSEQGRGGGRGRGNEPWGNKRPQFRNADATGNSYQQQQNRERQVSDQYQTSSGSPRSGSSGGGYHQQQGNGGGIGSRDRGQGNDRYASFSGYKQHQGYSQQKPSRYTSGGGKGGPEFIFTSDPYQAPPNLAKFKEEAVWKKFDYTDKKAVILQKRPQASAEWHSRKICVSVNHFPVIGIPRTLYQYQITCQLIRAQGDTHDGSGDAGRKPLKRKNGNYPDAENGAPRRVPKDLTESILKWLIPQMRQDSKHDAIATDFSTKLYTTKRLEELKSIHLLYEFTVDDLKKVGVIEKENADEKNNSKYAIAFQFANDGDTEGIIDTTPIVEYINRPSGDNSLRGFHFTPELKQTLEAAFNAFVKCVPRFPFYSVGRSTVVPRNNAQVEPLGEGLMAWRGVSMSVGMGWKPFLNVEVANTAMIKGCKVLDVMKDLLGRDAGRYYEVVGDIKRLGRHLEKVKSFMKTTKVQYTVSGLKFSKVVRDVLDVGANDASTKFEWTNSSGVQQKTTVYEYFKRKYGIQLQFANGPLLVSGKAKIPAELCTIKDGQSVNRKLSGSQTDKMLQFAKMEPQQHYNETMEKFRSLNLNKSVVLEGLGVQVPDVGMHKIPEVRVLVPPAMRYGKTAKGAAHFCPTDGEWEIWRQDNINFYSTPQEIKTWGILTVGCSQTFDDKQNYKYLKDFVKLLKQQGNSKGISISDQPIEEFDYDCRSSDALALTNLKILKKAFDTFKQAKCQFVLVILPQKNDPLYGHVKHAAEVDIGILTQCLQVKSVVGNFKRPGPQAQLVQKVWLKLNMKLGGVNHVTVAPLDVKLASQFCRLLMDCPVLVIGADVTHPPPGSKKLMVAGESEPYSPSYAAVTGSVDRTCMPFMTEVRAQRKLGAGAAEIIQDLEAIIRKFLRAFYEKSNKTLLPLKIIYFRDGVGDGQFPEVLLKEMNAIRRACSSVPASVFSKFLGDKRPYQPQITFITVQKRHKTRMFWHDGNSIKNVPAGTVIDQDIVHPTETDFFLCSHKGLLGTSRPSRYHVLWDDSDFSLDTIQSLAYTLCYMYGRCTKSVKMPAPTYYAHLAADRAKKLCEGFEEKLGEPSIENLNTMLARETGFWQKHPMHFI